MPCEASARSGTEQRQDFHWQSGNGGSFATAREELPAHLGASAPQFPAGKGVPMASQGSSAYVDDIQSVHQCGVVICP